MWFVTCEYMQCREFVEISSQGVRWNRFEGRRWDVAAIGGRAQVFVGTTRSKRSPLVGANRAVTTHMVQNAKKSSEQIEDKPPTIGHSSHPVFQKVINNGAIIM
jgi:hypothetical protein